MFQLSQDDALSTRMIRAFRAYLLAQSGAVAEGVRELHAIVREEHIPDCDPCQSLYHLFYFLALPESRDEDSDDRFTVLNKAFKLLQERTVRIDHESVKKQFLNENYWNGRLVEEARAARLM